jgi:Tfp pilus assembly protein PilX
MADQPSRTYSDLIALLVAAVIMLIMISITEAAAIRERVAANLDDASANFPQTERIGSPIRREGISLRWQ